MAIEEIRRRNLRLLKPMVKHVISPNVALNSGNTNEHELEKVRMVLELMRAGRQVVTEAVFHNGCRADIFVLDSGRVIEILHSETEEEAKEKTKNYPLEISRFTYIKTGGKENGKNENR